MKQKKFGSSRTIRRRVIKRSVSLPGERSTISKEAIKPPPKSFKLVKAKTNINGFWIIAPAAIIRQHMTFDDMVGMGRIIAWHFLKEGETDRSIDHDDH